MANNGLSNPSTVPINPFEQYGRTQRYGYQKVNAPIQYDRLGDLGMFYMGEDSYAQGFEFYKKFINLFGVNNFFLDNILPTFASKPSDVTGSSVVRYVYGQELTDMFSIKGIVTGTGVHRQVVISFYGPGNSNVKIFYTGDSFFVGSSQYTVVDHGQDVDGYPTATVVRNDGQMIDVFNYNGVRSTYEFTAGTKVQSFGQFYDEDCVVPREMNVQMPGPEREVRLSKFGMTWRYNTTQLTQALTTGQYQIFDFEAVGPDGQTTTVSGLLSNAEVQMIARFLSNCDKNRMFGQFNVNLNNRGQGHSLMDQVSVENRMFYNRNRNLYEYVRDEVNTRLGMVATSSMELTLVCGPDFYTQFQKDCDKAQVIERRTEPNRSQDQAAELYYLGQYYGGFTIDTGRRINVVQAPSLAKVGGEVGRKRQYGTYTAMLFDSGNLVDLDMTTMNFEESGEGKIATIQKRNAANGEIEGLVMQYQEGTRRPDGSVIRGSVREFTNEVTKSVWMEAGVAIKDPFAFYTLEPQV